VSVDDVLRDSRLLGVVREQPYPLLFVTISGAHLYGFPSPDSDFDLRGVHVLPVLEVVGLKTGPDTLELSNVRDGLEIDLVTHDARKFFSLLLKRNGYVLEQLYSPLVVLTTPEHEELCDMLAGASRAIMRTTTLASRAENGSDSRKQSRDLSRRCSTCTGCS
jgi:predicted nucleotidyltransferase